MLLYNDVNIVIREMNIYDIDFICEEEVMQGWHSTPDKYLARLKDQASGKSVALVAEYFGNVAGYINVYLKSMNGPFAGLGYCEIVDFGVLEKYRNHGIGSKLMDVAEKIAEDHANTVYLAVGLHSGYGRAQRMYIKRGYIPDGSGIWYKDKIAKPYENYCNNDDLTLYLSKKLY